MMGHGKNRTTSALMLGAFIALAGCAGDGGGGEGGRLSAAERSCEAAVMRKGDTARCDRYVDAAIAAGDKAEIAKAYLLRSLMYEFGGDLPSALADTDRAIAAWPDLTVAKRRHAQLLAENGDYAGAGEAFARLRGIDEDPAFDETLALLEYVDGDRVKTAPLFRSAATSYLEEDEDPVMAAYLNFDAAIVESEMRNGDLAPIAAIEETSKRDKMLALLWRHRMGEIDDAGLLQAVQAMPKSRYGPLTCMPYFSIGHRYAMAGKRDAAVAGFRQALQDCRAQDFEYHAAKAWLKQLGG